MEYISRLKINGTTYRVKDATGSGGVAISDVTGASVQLNGTTAEITWTDPNDTIIDGYTLATWGGTKVVRKANSAPQDVDDGVLIMNSTIRNAYSSTALTDSGLERGTTYYYGFFPYTTNNKITHSTDISVKTLTIATFADGTDKQIKEMLDAYYADEITWEDMGWAIGDTRKIHLNSMYGPSPISSSPIYAQDITVVIVAHDHTDLETAINGHTKACITVQTREALGDTDYSGKNGTIYINGDDNVDTSFKPWVTLYMRTYMNSTLLGGFASGAFKNAIKPSKHYRLGTNGNMTATSNTTDGSQSNRKVKEVIDTLFLPSYPEIFGNVKYNYYLGGGVPNSEEGTQFPYYATSSNRKKYSNYNGSPSSNAIYWWPGSPSSRYDSNTGYHWCVVTTDGSVLFDNGTNARGLAPAFAM